jgi:imidazolonepropionase-like amidohydrolase
MSAADAAMVAPVLLQLEAYNAHDLDRFLRAYHPEVILAKHPGDEVVTRGTTQMRAQYAKAFANNPRLHSEVVNRMVSGNFVIDHESITGLEKAANFDAVVVYHVADGLIDRAWFLPKHYLAQAPKPITALVGAAVVFPGRSGDGAVVPGQTVLIEGDRIKAVGPSARVAVPPAARTIDVSGKWITAGLIDTHVHFFQSGGLYTRPDAIDLRKLRSYENETTIIRNSLSSTFKRWLASGVTSVVDVGGPFWNFEVRDLARTTLAPRVAVAGPLVSTVDLEPVHRMDLADPPIIAVKSPEEARVLIRRELSRKPDFAKVWFLHRPGDDLKAQEQICRAVGEEAHAAGVRLAVHATQLEVAKAALRAGADVLVHSVNDQPLDDEFIRLAKERSISYGPTLYALEGYLAAFDGDFAATEEEKRLGDPDVLSTLDDIKTLGAVDRPAGFSESLAKRKASVPLATATALANLKRAFDAGISVTLATDAGNIGTIHGPSVFREMRRMVDAGLSPREVLLAATVNGARFFGRPDDLGSVEPGRLADLVVVNANPIEDISNMGKVSWVVKGGEVIPIADLLNALGTKP